MKQARQRRPLSRSEEHTSELVFTNQIFFNRINIRVIEKDRRTYVILQEPLQNSGRAGCAAGMQKNFFGERPRNQRTHADLNKRVKTRLAPKWKPERRSFRCRCRRCFSLIYSRIFLDNQLGCRTGFSHFRVVCGSLLCSSLGSLLLSDILMDPLQNSCAVDFR